MLVLSVIQEIDQTLMHTRMVHRPQVSGLSMFGDMLAKELSTGATRSRAVALGERQ